jgi:DNA primase catalytic subunit
MKAVRTEIKKIKEDKQEEFDNEMKGMKKEMKKLTDKITEMESGQIVNDMKQLQDEVQSLSSKYSDVVKTGAAVINTGNSGSSVDTSVRNVRVEVHEALDRDKRKNNLVIFGLDETLSLSEIKVKISDAIVATGLQDVEGIKFVGRIGKEEAAKTRPYRIEVGNSDIKRSIMLGTNKLKADPAFARVYIRPDQTKLQQKIDRELRTKLKELQDAGKSAARINNGEIVEFVDGIKQVLFKPADN